MWAQLWQLSVCATGSCGLERGGGARQLVLNNHSSTDIISSKLEGAARNWNCFLGNETPSSPAPPFTEKSLFSFLQNRSLHLGVGTEDKRETLHCLCFEAGTQRAEGRTEECQSLGSPVEGTLLLWGVVLLRTVRGAQQKSEHLLT